MKEKEEFLVWFRALLAEQPSRAHYNVLIGARDALWGSWRLEQPHLDEDDREGYFEVLARQYFGGKKSPKIRFR